MRKYKNIESPNCCRHHIQRTITEQTLIRSHRHALVNLLLPLHLLHHIHRKLCIFNNNNMPSIANIALTAAGLASSVLAMPASTSLNTANPLTSRALGINCRGSGLCPLATLENHSGVRILQLWHDILAATDKDPNTVYNSGDHIVCVGTSVSITVGASAGAEVEGISGEISLSTDVSIGTGGVCLFPQGASLTLQQIRDLVDALGEHGCATCGSVPIHFVDQGSNDPSSGILTSNYVGNPFCKFFGPVLPFTSSHHPIISSSCSQFMNDACADFSYPRRGQLHFSSWPVNWGASVVLSCNTSLSNIFHSFSPMYTV